MHTYTHVCVRARAHTHTHTHAHTHTETQTHSQTHIVFMDTDKRFKKNRHAPAYGQRIFSLNTVMYISVCIIIIFLNVLAI